MSSEPPRSAWWPWLPVVLIALGIFLGSSVAGTSLPRLGFAGQDKLVHLGEYGLLGFFARRALVRWLGDGPRTRTASVLAAMAVAFVYGLSDEFHQSFVPGRSVEALDVLADVTGGLTGAVVHLHLWSRRLRKDRSR
jgi:VanZ family protein